MARLYAWKESDDRKPLIMQGARQVGKTWLMKEFAREAYARCAYVNFEENEMVRGIFAHDFETERVTKAIQWATGVEVDEGTLLVLDEIQEAERGVTALKYFREKAPHLHVMAAGSLLGVAMHRNDSFPVGKVDFLTLHPLTFFEFLNAVGECRMVETLRARDWESATMFRARFEERLRQYYYVGGMPAAVAAFVEKGDLQRVRDLQNGILESYERDFSKHAPAAEVPRIRMVWRSVPSQLAKENRKFVYGAVREGSRAKDFELSLEWLRDAGLIHRVSRCKSGQLPLAAYEDFSAFKVYLSDVGLLSAMCGLPPESLLGGNGVLADFKGALTEQYVLQQLMAASGLSVYYWSAENSRGELDFLLQRGTEIIPVEVKAEENLRAKSLRAFVERHPGLHGMRLSMSPYRSQEWLTNYPLYALPALF